MALHRPKIPPTSKLKTTRAPTRTDHHSSMSATNQPAAATHAIHTYYSEVEKLIHYGGTTKETAVRTAFYNLLNDYARQHKLLLVPEVTLKTKSHKNITPDGTLKDALRLDWGYWESKDTSDDLDAEIAAKFAKGYPNDNILFEDSQTAVLYQNGAEVRRVPIADAEKLHALLTDFVSFERPEVSDFRKAIEHFKEDIPNVTGAIRDIILAAATTGKNPAFTAAFDAFLALCRESINPAITPDDVREMLIQHILTEDIFNTIFDEIQFHRENNIARELENVIQTFFTGETRRATLARIKHYYDAINANAAAIADHHEKQKFLKVVYENFYKSYNPKAADRLGVVYTPNEIVRFMVQSVDWLLHKHFGKYLEDKNVEILDPATGTGTFVCELIDHIRREKLEYKYRHEIHANEVAILPYYISNLNIEFTYAQKFGNYAAFDNLCFVDTLDNIGFAFAEKQEMMPFLSRENSERIRKQNQRKIAVIIGNPPYNANQTSENDNNPNREYPEIDKRIRSSFIYHSTAQKTKVYDMYARFYRWAFDRLDNNGIVAFVTNRSFIDSRTFDGFRKTIQDEFDAAYIIDTHSDVRANPKIAGTSHNIFGIQTGVAIMFLVKKAASPTPVSRNCEIRYISLDDFWRKEIKLQWLAENKIQDIPFEIIRPDKNNNWINLAESDFDTLLPLISKDVKLRRGGNALFEMFSLGVVTARDDWVYDFDKVRLRDKVRFLIDIYNKDVELHGGADKRKIRDVVDYSIKWTRAVKNDLSKGLKYIFKGSDIVGSLYRPFVKKKLYFNNKLNEMRYQLPSLFEKQNLVIAISGTSTSKPFSALVTDTPYCYDLLEKTQCLPLYRYDSEGERVDNITDWGLAQFRARYKDSKKKITKPDIFHYVYAVLHNPAYREKYKLNLKREFPRIPFYEDFWQWASWGKRLLDLHLNYETAKPFPLKVTTASARSSEQRHKTGTLPFITDPPPKPKLKADKDSGTIILDDATTLTGIPPAAWEYKLGNRSALEWILDQYKEKKPSDPTIAEKFNTYRFADYKPQVIPLLTRVCTVSVETMKIIAEMTGKSAI